MKTSTLALLFGFTFLLLALVADNSGWLHWISATWFMGVGLVCMAIESVGDSEDKE